MAKYGMFPRKVLIDGKTGAVISSKNLTDKIAVRLLKELPSAKKKIFEVQKYEAMGFPSFGDYQELLILEEQASEVEAVEVETKPEEQTKENEKNED